MRAAGQKWETIADELGYATRGAACNDVARALAERITEQNDAGDQLRELELEHLDVLRRRLGKLIENDADDEVALKAIDRLIKISERRSKLQGLDAPVKVEQGGTVRYEVVGIEPDAHR